MLVLGTEEELRAFAGAALAAADDEPVEGWLMGDDGLMPVVFRRVEDDGPSL